jgi:hypothetical protein
MDARTQVAQALAEWRMLCSPDKVVQLKVIASSLQRLGHGENRCYANAAGDKYRALSVSNKRERIAWYRNGEFGSSFTCACMDSEPPRTSPRALRR